jgi:hypothetical protein
MGKPPLAVTLHLSSAGQGVAAAACLALPAKHPEGIATALHKPQHVRPVVAIDDVAAVASQRDSGSGWLGHYLDTSRKIY